MQAAIAAVSSIRVGEGTPKERKGKQSWEQTARPEVKRALKESMTQLGSVPSEAAAVIGTEGQAGGASEELSYPPGFGPTPQFVVATIPVVGVTPLEENAMAAEDQVEGKDEAGKRQGTGDKAAGVTKDPTATGPGDGKLAVAKEGENQMMSENKSKSKGTAPTGSVLGKRDAREQGDSVNAGTEEDAADPDQNKKKKGANGNEAKSNNGKDGGQEATGQGAPGLLVGATDSTRQEP